MKQKKVTPSTAKSNFSGVTNYNVALDGLGSGNAMKQGNTISSSANLADPYKQLQTSALSGLNAQQSTIGKDPSQLYADITAGNNPFYNAYKAQADLSNQQAYDSLQNRMSQSGLNNSSVFGGYAAQQALQNTMQNSQLQSQALTDQLNAANMNAGSNQNTLNGIAQLQQYLTQQPSQSLMQGLSNADQVAMFNAQQTQSANQANAQASNGFKNSLIGNGLGAALTLGSMFIPGAQAFTPLLGASMLGRGAASAFGGGGGGAAPGYAMNNISGYMPSSYSSFANPYVGRMY